MDVGHKCILLVEDEAFIAMEEADALSELGHRVVTVYSGGEAVEKVRASADEIDLILMDINLGQGMDGIEAARDILTTHDIPIVFLSSHSEKEVIERIESVTSYGYVLKKSGMTVLKASIAMAFKLHAAYRRLKEKENQASESEKNYRAIFENTGTAVVIFNEESVIVHANAQFESLSGYSRDEIEGKMTWSDFVSPEDLEKMLAWHRLRNDNCKDVPRQYEFTFVTKAGVARDIFLTVEMIPGSMKRVASLMDITDRKMAERILFESEARYRRMFENSIMGIFQTNSEGELVSINPALAAMLGYASIDELLAAVDRKASRLYADPRERDKYVGMIIGSDSLRKFESEFIKKDGTIAVGLLYAWPRYDTRGTLLGIEGFVDDVTERKRAEEKLTETLRQLDDIIEFLPDATFVIDRDRKVIYWNKAIEHMTGVKKADMMGKGDYAYAVPFYGERRPILIDLVDHTTAELEANYTQVRRVENNVYAETYIAHMNQGRGLYLRGSAAPLFDSDGERIGAIEIIRDITERKYAEEALRESESKYRQLFTHAPAGIWEVDFTTGRFVRVNSLICEYTGYSEEELLTMNTFDILTDESKKILMERLKKIQAGENVPDVLEYLIKEKNGNTRWVELYNDFIRHDGIIVGSTVVAHDISERKRAEEKINDLLAEKELLLKEVHHRIKNNMNTIMSLLALQSTAAKETAVSAALNDAVRRMQGMAVLYDKLYRSENLREISIQSYLSTLVDEVMAMFPGDTVVRVEKHIEDIRLGVTVLSSLGMIVNELITNAMKYAFTGMAEGIITVSVTSHDNRATLAIKDNGRGIPGYVDVEKSGGFGFTLVRMLVKQLKGNLSIAGDGGATIAIDFTL